MVVGFDLEGGVGEAVALVEQLASLVEHGVGVGADAHHEVGGGDLHVGGEGPHVEIVDVDHSRDAGEILLEPGHVEPRGGGLDEHAQRFPTDAEGAGRMKTPMAAPMTGSTHVQPVRPQTMAATMTPTEPSVSESTST